ncbi:MAG: hypothetical protein JWM11_1074, partial [Planctomycetaceae bacterium]|nr:hypothetical protein [Planctomycetaceae bacterium]
QALHHAGVVRAWSTAHAGGGLQNYYKLTPTGFERLYGSETRKPPRTFFAEISPTFFEHTLNLAEVIVETVRACHTGRVKIQRLFRENELTFTVGSDHVQPDCFVRFEFGGKPFNVAFEIDQGTESVDSNAENSIRTKLRIYDAYQETLLTEWLASGKTWERPRFRLAFLTNSIDRVHHILATAARMTCNGKRRLAFAATQDCFLAEQDPIRSPIFLDHMGQWQSLVDLHPTSPHRKQPVRLKPLMVAPSSIW